MVLEPRGTGYSLNMLSMVGGGKLEISAGSSLKLSLWDEKGDGKCDECLQHFEVSEYEMKDGRPDLIRKLRAEEKYKPGDFQAHRIVLVQ